MLCRQRLTAKVFRIRGSIVVPDDVEICEQKVVEHPMNLRGTGVTKGQRKGSASSRSQSAPFYTLGGSGTAEEET